MNYKFVVIERPNPSGMAKAIDYETNEVIAEQTYDESVQRFLIKVIKGHTDLGWKIEYFGFDEFLLIFRK